MPFALAAPSAFSTTMRSASTWTAASSSQGGGVGRLTESEFNLFLMLWQKKPRLVSREQLMAEAYWLRSDGDEPEIKIIDVHICKIRRKLAPLGLSIDTVWGRGYRILLKGEVVS